MTKIDALHVETFAYLIQKLQHAGWRRLAAGSFADPLRQQHSDGNAHTHHDLPLVLVGAARGQVKGGRHIRYPRETPMNNLLLTMLDKAGVPAPEKVGDSTGEDSCSRS